MADISIKVDADTHRALNDLAYLLDTTKKAVVADAIADFTARYGAVVKAPRKVTFDELPLMDRFALRKPALLRTFAKRNATDPRLMHRDDDDPEAPIRLLVTTDLARGSGESFELERLARIMIRGPVEVESATKLDLFDKPALERAIANSSPL